MHICSFYVPTYLSRGNQGSPFPPPASRMLLCFVSLWWFVRQNCVFFYWIFNLNTWCICVSHKLGIKCIKAYLHHSKIPFHLVSPGPFLWWGSSPCLLASAMVEWLLVFFHSGMNCSYAWAMLFLWTCWLSWALFSFPSSELCSRGYKTISMGLPRVNHPCL